jgi:hypothetical protein
VSLEKHPRNTTQKIPSFIKAAFYVQKYCRKEYIVSMPQVRQVLKSRFIFHVASRQTGIQKCNVHLLAIYKNASTNGLASVLCACTATPQPKPTQLGECQCETGLPILEGK